MMTGARHGEPDPHAATVSMAPVSLARAPLEAVRLAGLVGLDRRRLAQQLAEVDEVFLRC